MNDEIDTQGKRPMTVGELRALLAKLPGDMTVAIGVGDDEYNVQGGIFLEAVQANVFPDDHCLQIAAYTDIAAEADM